MRFVIDENKLLTGFYEARHLPQNFSENSTVPGFAYNILNTSGLLYRPVVNENYLSNGGKRPTWPNANFFAGCLTHDVDDVSAYSFKQSLRALRSPFNGLSSTAQKAEKLDRLVKRTIKSALFGFRKDPFHCYERWLDIEKEFDAKSTFFFWPGWSNVQKHHHTDCRYELHDSVLFDGQKCNLTEMMREIQRRGWEIGLHPSWYTFNDFDELKRQKAALETALGCAIDSVRQHYLHYDIRSTPRVHAEAGFKFDSTLGFNDNIGFRFGTCYPWKLFDLQANKALPIIEIPLIIQDSAMLSPIKGLRIDEETAYGYIIQLAQAVEAVAGVLTLLWHPNEVSREKSIVLYSRILHYLRKQNCWLSSVKEIGGWWLKRQLTEDE